MSWKGPIKEDKEKQFNILLSSLSVKTPQPMAMMFEL
jgi:hypothetical protein